MRALIQDAADRASTFLEQRPKSPVFPTPEAIHGLDALAPFPHGPSRPEEVLRLLDEHASPATVASTGGRYYGYVIGGALPATVASHILATAWDQNGAFWSTSPVIGRIEEITLDWLKRMLGLTAETGGAFVGGSSIATFCGLAAARNHLLAQNGWDVESDGLHGAPRIKVVVSEESHPSINKALGLLGLGRNTVTKAPTDDQGRIRIDSLPALDEHTVLCAQAGNVNTGSVDPLADLADHTSAAGAWLHVDGAIGAWAAAVPAMRPMMAGIERADSIAASAHKWLNVPYDCGIAFTRHPDALRRSMRMTAAYLPESGRREPSEYTPEMSRRARAVDVWAALKQVGHSGLAHMIETSCRHARTYADAFRAAGHDVLNDVVLNQVLVRFGDPDVTKRTIESLQRDGIVWCGGTVWQGKTAMRLSVSSWATTDDDVQAGIQAILQAAKTAASPLART